MQEDSHGDPTAAEQNKNESFDSRGNPGWDRVDHLARALLNLSGLSVTNLQAKEIKMLYDDLLPYDKAPLQF